MFFGVDKRERRGGGTCEAEQVSLPRCEVNVKSPGVTVSDIFLKRRESSSAQLQPPHRDKL